MASRQLLLLAFLTLLFTEPVAGATFTVGPTEDTNDGVCESDGSQECSLREAIIATNRNRECVDGNNSGNSCEADEDCVGGTCPNTPDTINLRAGTYVLAIAGEFENSGLTGDLDVTDDLVLTGAGADTSTIDGNGIDRIFDIFSATVTISGLTIRNGNALDGAGIFNEGTLSVSNVVIRDNRADQDGGAIRNSAGTLSVTRSTLSNNEARRDSGGIDNFRGSLTVAFSTISGNQSHRFGGGITNFDGALTVNGSTIYANEASQEGGGIENFQQDDETTATITLSAIRGNRAGTGGAGIGNVRGQLTVSKTAITDNVAKEFGGGIQNKRGAVDVTASTLSGNSAVLGGGGIVSEGEITSEDPDASVIIRQTTISGNVASGDASAEGFRGAGGILNLRKSTVSLRNTTIAKNVGGGILDINPPDGVSFATDASHSILADNILADNTPMNCLVLIDSGGHNLATDQSCGLDGETDLPGEDPAGLGPLRNNGGPNVGDPRDLDRGPTETHALLLTSPAIDKGDPAGGDCQPTDQRGILRPQGTACDIGAVELSFAVTTDQDENDGACGTEETDRCSLREAIIAAKPGRYYVPVPAGIYELTVPGTDEDAAETGDLDLATPGCPAKECVDGDSAGTPCESKEECVGGACLEAGPCLVLTGSGPALTIIDGGGADRVFHILPDAKAEISGMTIRNGRVRSNDSGGAIDNAGILTLTNTVIVGNRSDQDGGGINNGGTLTITDSLISGNATPVDGEGGGINNESEKKVTVARTTISGNQARRGGGIRNEGTMVISESTVSGNKLEPITAAGNLTVGGGILNEDTLTLENTTVSGNQAAEGGGIVNAGSLAATKLINSTVTGNDSLDDDGGGLRGVGTFKLSNAIVAGNTPDNCAGSTTTFVTGGYNLDDDASCGLDDSTDLSGVNDAGLGPLGYNGGPTETHALCAGAAMPHPDCTAASPAIDAGDDASCLATDQHGVARPQPASESERAVCDIGAFELGCGHGVVNPGNQCREEVEQEVPPAGGTVTTDGEGDGATESDLMETAVTSPNPGTVSITEVLLTPEPFTAGVRVAAPFASAASPLELVFRINASKIQDDTNNAVQISTQGATASPCIQPTGVAEPDPCVASRALLDDGDVEIKVLTAHAAKEEQDALVSEWRVAIPRLCAEAPVTGCRTPKRSKFFIKDEEQDKDAGDKLLWKWQNGAATLSDFADPPTATGDGDEPLKLVTTTYALCVYDGTGLLLDATIPPGRWEASGATAFKYRDREAAAAGIFGALFKGSSQGKAKILIKGKGVNLPDKPVGQLTGLVTAQLVRRDGTVCWEDTYDTDTALKNDGKLFKAKRR